MGKLKEALDGIATKISAAAQDFTTLEVVTCTGTINVKLDGDAPVNLKDVLALVKDAAGPTAGQVKIAAYTNIDFDQDTVVFRQDGADAEILQLHDNAVQAAQESRKAMLHFIKEVIE